ncbi:MAG: M23 family metallopeptidase [Anaerolineales bacterium]
MTMIGMKWQWFFFSLVMLLASACRPQLMSLLDPAPLSSATFEAAVNYNAQPSQTSFIKPSATVNRPRITITPSRFPIVPTATLNPNWLFPDSEVVYSPAALDFDVQAYLDQTDGWLKHYREYLKSTAWTSAAKIIQRVALENSINPRILLALLEYHCGCVLGNLSPDVDADFLLGNTDFHRKGLFRQLSWASSRLSAGYYGWRAGAITGIDLGNQLIIPISNQSNAGSVALQYFFAFYHDASAWRKAIDSEDSFVTLYGRMFGDFWQRAAIYEPLIPPTLKQPPLILPFEPGRMWAFTSGPHVVWETEGAVAALDFAPATYESGCVNSDAWITAMANGVIARSEFGAVILDLDNQDGTPADGCEQTGWAILYMHVAEDKRIPAGTRVKTGDRIGHPSCEGGRATGTHVHIARKYNGEWILADGAIPFNIEGWVAHAGKKLYEGTLTRAGQIVIAHPYGSYETKISRPTPTLLPTPNVP